MDRDHLGFIGLGVMGEPMCRNLLERGPFTVTGLDLDARPVERLRKVGLLAADSVAAVAENAGIIVLSLPGEAQVEAVVDDLCSCASAGTLVVDTSTSPVDATRGWAERLGTAGIDFVDAPVARTRAAAANGTLSIMVGGNHAQFARARAVLDHMASDVTHCGPIGSGQAVKLLNNMVLAQTVVALAEALAIGRGAGLDGGLLFDTLAKGSADSFALRNHGMKAILPGAFPTDAFSTEYMSKDIEYALRLARDVDVDPPGARLTAERLIDNTRAGRGGEYFPSLAALYGGADSD